MKQILLKTCSHLLLVNVICAMGIILLIGTPSFADLEWKLTDADNIVADGTVDTDEWTDAGYIVDQFGDGSFYGMYRQDYTVNHNSYTGKFYFFLHNIEQLKEDNDWDYNFFYIFQHGDFINPLLSIYVFDNVDSPDDSWFIGPNRLQSLIGGTTFDDRGFLVYNYDESDYVHWLPGDPGPEDGEYAWDYYYGVYAAGGFNNSAYEEDLALAKDNNNELYEVICNSPLQLEVIAHDPPFDPIDVDPIIYVITPEPATIALLG
jgi:hypothetical protein